MAPEASAGQSLKRKSPGIAGQGFGVNHFEAIHMGNTNAISKENNAQLGTVEFLGKPLTVITTDSQLLVAMRPICEGIGLSWQSQYNRIQRDEVLSKGVVVMNTPSAGGEQRTLCLPLGLLNGWLFGVDSRRCKPFIRQALVRYKFECYDALAAYWQQCAAKALPTPAALPAPDDAERIFHAFRGSRIEFLYDGKAIWVKASCICTALSIGGSDRIARSLPESRKVYRMRGQQRHVFVDAEAAMRASGYVQRPELAKEWEHWLAEALQAIAPSANPAPPAVEGFDPVERYGLMKLLGTRLLVTLDEHGGPQVRPIPMNSLVVPLDRLADVVSDPCTVPVEYLPGLMQAVAGRLGAAMQRVLPHH